MSNSELCFRVTAASNVFASSDVNKSRTLYALNVQETRGSAQEHATCRPYTLTSHHVLLEKMCVSLAVNQ